ncbi:P-loop containing nucleoside triphosphate hydrolase protein [Periconia macrospinosa]|uniref:P-loop containing nucleoside triphosphate hydrolase protein n=1 Tax=Periconia macrospinosa TaxID=97972 RepID=A0A2V1DSG6_9PLEO|nr:P-loop containing nucleoside triphosphate hydrolase protein [Periconia macrospinosa]
MLCPDPRYKNGLSNFSQVQYSANFPMVINKGLYAMQQQMFARENDASAVTVDLFGGLGIILVKEVKEAISIVTKLEDLGLQQDLPLPKCIVLGEQSTGKSSVIEAISGITTPRSTDTCTRCPLFINMEESKAGSDWYAEVTLRKEYNFDGKNRRKFPGWVPNPNPNQELIGSAHSLNELEAVIAAAQTAALNPYPNQTCEFSPNIVCISVSHPSFQALSFYDLPGIIGQTEHEDKQYLVKFVKDLVGDYIKDSLVLVVCSLENDIANSTAAGLAREKRVTDHCVGVLTKPDRLPVGTREEKLISILAGHQFKLGHGYFVVKNPSQDDLDQELTHREARIKEQEFFTTNEPWATSLQDYRERFGTDNLQKSISNKLASQIVQHLPQLHEKVIARLKVIDEEISCLPEPPNNPMRAITDAIMNFSEHVCKELQADYPCRDWRNHWKRLHERLLEDLTSLKPKLRIRGRLDAKIFSVPEDNTQDSALYISDEDGDGNNSPVIQTPQKKRKRSEQPTSIKPSPAPGPQPSTSDRFTEYRKVFLLDDMATHLSESKSYNMNLLEPKAVEDMIRKTFVYWEKPLDVFFKVLSHDIKQMIKGIFEKYFSCWANLAIYPQTWRIIEEVMNSSLAEQQTMTQDSLEDEREGPFTLFEDRESEEYKRTRNMYGEARLSYRVGVYRAEYQAHTGRIAPDTDKLRKDEKVWTIIAHEPYDEEINLIAKVTSYYQIASRRFYEAVVMRVHSKFFKRLRTTLRSDLELGLGLSENGLQLATELLAEPSHRLELRKKLLVKRRNLEEGLDLVQGLLNKYGCLPPRSA